MGVLLNHAVAFVTSPLSVSFAAFLAAAAALCFTRRRLAVWLFGFALAYLYVFSSGWCCALLGTYLETMYPPQAVEALPEADAIVLLGGGVRANTNELPYTEMYAGSDRVAHAARLWKAKKAPLVITSGIGENDASRPLLAEFGVDPAAILIEDRSLNTEENARFVARTLAERSHARILLVTSSWHMRRALLMFRKYAPTLEVVPAATDYETLVCRGDDIDAGILLPSAEALFRTSYFVKEIVGYWGYRLLR